MIDLLKSHTGFDPKNVENPSNIRNLYVGHNNLTHIDLSKFTNLESLDIGHNNIDEIYPEYGLRIEIKPNMWPPNQKTDF